MKKKNKYSGDSSRVPSSNLKIGVSPLQQKPWEEKNSSHELQGIYELQSFVFVFVFIYE